MFKRGPSGPFLAAALLAAPVLGVLPASAASAACPHLSSDFNGDGYADVAAGAPEAGDVPSGSLSGAVTIAYGAADGIDTGSTPPHTFTARSVVEATGDEGSLGSLGYQIATGYFDGDCFADLAVSGQNRVAVLYGSDSGLGTDRAKLFDKSSIEGGETRIWFGDALAAGDFDGDGLDDLAIGASGLHWNREVGTPDTDDDGGAVGILPGSDSGLTTDGAFWLTQDSPGVPGGAESLDGFGRALAAADFDLDGRADLAIGTPFEALSAGPVGAVVVVRGSAEGLTGTGAQWFDQGTAGVPGNPEEGDHFGRALAAGDLTGDGRPDLVIASPDEAIGQISSAGAIAVLKSGPTGVSATGALGFDQSDPQIPGEAENDFFGAALAIGDLNRDGRADLAVGSPNESVGSAPYTGAVILLYSGSGGITATGSRWLDQNSTGIPGANEDSDAFGSALHVVPGAYGGRNALVVGSPGEDTGSAQDSGAFTVVPGDAAGIPGPTGYFFGPSRLPDLPGRTDLGSSLG
ncbi:FG-GAP repeat protein [Mangrovihabitans endophyticus]|uniref:FG-GAP repeat-containing protein n=1 Tax=Mangrovihabitans endophyticus TaxID=1751298 RepID=A0A8J3C125_9ACTN|nr:FG-GAP repeat protein [Mangrovihabitans endophyticus]GGK95194.1 hypothetical protein GCM10012284_31570 [Mangrovihabitans endophyticus]